MQITLNANYLSFFFWYLYLIHLSICILSPTACNDCVIIFITRVHIFIYIYIFLSKQQQLQIYIFYACFLRWMLRCLRVGFMDILLGLSVCLPVPVAATALGLAVYLWVCICICVRVFPCLVACGLFWAR